MKKPRVLITFALVTVAALAWAACGDDTTGPSVATIEVTPATASVLIGGTVQLTAVARDGSGNPMTVNLTWTSSSAAASVSSSGLVTGEEAGTSTVTASAGGHSGSSEVTVLEPVASVEVTPAVDTVRAGQTIQLTATPKDAGGNSLTGREITWSSDDEAIATVDDTGVVTGEDAGATTITATSEGQSGMADVTVYIGITGNWSGMVIAPAGNCPLGLSITEDLNGDVTGTADLDPPCTDENITVTGTNNTDAVPDSVSLTFVEGAFVFDGGFDGIADMLGLINGGGCTNCATSFTRNSIAPTPPAGTARAGKTAPVRKPVFKKE